MLLPHIKDLRRRGLVVLAALVVLTLATGLPPATAATATAHPQAAHKHRDNKAAGHKKPGRKKVRPPKGTPPEMMMPRPGAVFSYPNRSTKERFAIRRKVLHTIRSTWGSPRDQLGAAGAGAGTIRISTWSFNDKTIARALWRAHRRGVSVQVTAAAGANREHRAWHWLRHRLHSRLHARRHPETVDRWSFARKCKGSCRGHGGTSHAKYFLFTNVGAGHLPAVTIQTSMNLTRMAYMHQWNQATITWGRDIHRAFASVFAEARRARPVRHPFRWFQTGGVANIFFPRPHAKPAQDPVMRTLAPVRCKGATGGGVHHRTRIRVIQYAIYDTRGLGLARRLRQLWNRGCNVKIIYSITSGPVLSILRSPAGRGPIPMRQSVIRNSLGQLAVYNHSKWMAITGRYGAARNAWIVLPGSANWSNFALSSDEQMQIVGTPGWVRPYLRSFKKTWRQRTSKPPYSWGAGYRMFLPPPVNGEPVFGQGELEFTPED